MRNLKRALSLALASIMLIGLMVTGAGAVSAEDFTDKDEIQHQEAVTTMVALGVINGKEDGSYFDPTGIVTRAEMAKMITVALNGGTDPVLATTSKPSYSDIKGHWAESYIEYCTSRSIISGRGNGKFDPDATVTAAEAAKMILTALGYDATVFGLTGTSWQIKTDVLANDSKANLYKGLSNLSSSNDLSRDNAAQMIYNALDAYVMERSYDQVLANGQVTYSYKLSDTTTFIMDAFNAVKVEGIVTGNEVAVLTNSSTGNHLDANRTRIQVTNHGTGDGEQNSFSGSLTLQAATGLDELGRAVSVYVKSSSSASKATVLGGVIVSGDNVVVTDYSGDSIAKVADDNNLNLVSGTKTALNYASLTEYVSTVAGNSTRGVEKILIDNDDNGDVDYVLLNTYAFGKVTSYVTSGDGSIVVSTKPKDLTASDKDDVTGFADVAKNDYVLAAAIGGKLYVEKAESVTGSLDSYRTTTVDASTYATKLEINGNNYNVSWIDGYTQGSDNIQAAKAYGSDTNLEAEATFYLGKGDYVAAVGDAAENAYNYALVMAKGSDINDQVKVMLSDGTVGTYTLSSSGVQLSAVNKGQVYSYTLSSSGTIKLTAVTAGYTDSSSGANKASFTKGKTAVSTGDNNETSYATANTVFFYINGSKGATTSKGDINIYTGYTSAPSLRVGSAIADIYRNSATRAVAVVFWGNNITTGNVEDLIYLTNTGNRNSDRMLADAFLAGSADLVKDTKIDLGGNTTKQIPQVYSVNSDGYYELSNVDSNNIVNDVTVSNSNSNTFVYKTAGGMEYEVKITPNTLLIDDSSYLDDPTAELGAGPEQGDKLAYVVFSRDNNSPDEAKMVVVKNTNAGGGTEVSTTAVLQNSDSATNYANPTFYRASGSAITLAEMQSLLRTQMTADGCSNIIFTGNTAVSYVKDNATVNTTFTTPLTDANHHVYKVTLNTTAGYYIAGTTFKDSGSTGVNLAGTFCFINAAATPTATSVGHTVTGGDTDAAIDAGYYSIGTDASVDVSGASTGLANGQTATATVDGANITYAKPGTTLIVELTLSAAADGDIAVTVSGTGITSITDTTKALTFNSSNKASVTVTMAAGASANISDLSIALVDKT